MRTAFGRLFSAVAIILLTALLLIGVSFQVLVRNYLTERTVEDLRTDAQSVAQLVQTYWEEDSVSSRDFHIALTMATKVSGADAVICDAKGKLLLCADAPLGCEHTGLMLDQDYLQRVFQENGSISKGTISEIYDEVRYVVSLPIQNEAGQALGVVIVSTPEDQAMVVLAQISRIFLVVSGLVVMIAVILMVFFLRRQSAPLRQMARVASAFGHGELTARVSIDGRNSEEVEELARAFNNMASSLQKSEYQRQEFVANVSHELKTPMTTIAGFVDGILDGTIPPERNRQYLQIVSDETKRLNRLVRSMLDISRLQEQGGIPEEQKSRFDVEECTGQVLITFERKIMEKGLEVQVEMPEHPLYTHANQDAITQVIYNLLDNGVKFCPQGGSLGIAIREGGGKIYVGVSNSGQTIPPEELPLVFDRFHKIDKSRSKNRDSWGLGLYIVKTIVDSHGENISVTSHDGKTTFTFTLPLVN